MVLTDDKKMRDRHGNENKKITKVRWAVSVKLWIANSKPGKLQPPVKCPRYCQKLGSPVILGPLSVRGPFIARHASRSRPPLTLPPSR